MQEVISWGPGGQGLVGGWPTRGVGHMFNVVNIDGVAVFIDGQKGLSTHVPSWREYWVARTR
ncbi:toxin glutamine deamidase domain-containing protein [Kitasatospora nipponensis]|uniref:toxin glutamine deamidase domain-containing protein n=1 Tax=Kitasatospora nipponensis TaxID=258049 RepID=UPI003CD08426